MSVENERGKSAKERRRESLVSSVNSSKREEKVMMTADVEREKVYSIRRYVPALFYTVLSLPRPIAVRQIVTVRSGVECCPSRSLSFSS